MLTGLALHLSG